MIKAVIFDFDGVIADTEHVHYEAFKKVLNLNNYDLTENEYYSKYLAYDDKTFFKNFYKDNDLKLSNKLLSQLLKDKSNRFDELIKDNLKIYPRVVEFIKDLSKGYILAIGSGALKKEINKILEIIEIDSLFRVIVAADDVEKCKPNPEVYINVLNQLNNINKKSVSRIEPEECIVIEDSVYGIQAAKNAGMKCVAVTNSYPKEKLKNADLIIDSLSIDNIEVFLNNY